jgi:hypothetical protein
MIVIKYKKMPTIAYMELDDYILAKKITIFRMWIPRDYNAVRKKYQMIITVRKYKKTAAIKVKYPKSNQIMLHSFFSPLNGLKLSKPPYFNRFRAINKTSFDDFAQKKISKCEWDILQSLPKFVGFFNHIVEFNDFSFFDDLQHNLEAEGLSFKTMFIHDVIIFELIRRQIGFRDYTGLEKLKGFLSVNPFAKVLTDSSFFPTAADVSYVMTQIPAQSLMTFFHTLVREAIKLKIIYPKILLGDGQFFRSNCNNNFKDKEAKKAKRYNDPEAGYCRHNGVMKGVGYDPWCFYAFMGFDRVLPVHFKMYPGNRNDNPAFRDTFQELQQLSLGEWSIVIVDSGAYSKKSLDFCIKNKTIPLIRARKNLKTHNTKELKKGYWFNADYFPPDWSDDDVLAIYGIRPMVEKALAPNNTYYNASRMNTRGIENATKHRVLYYILDLLRAITAFKVGRPDLICKSRAFTLTREAVLYGLWPKLAQDSGYMLLDEWNIYARHNSEMDKQRIWNKFK